MAVHVKFRPQLRQNSWRAIVKGARLETLPGAAVPVIIAIALAVGDICKGRLQEGVCDMGGVCDTPLQGVAQGWTIAIAAVLCLLFALIMQVNANLVNDYLDFKDGHDSDERQGNARVAANGLMTMPFMRKVILATNVLAAAVGLPLLLFGNWLALLSIGAACMVFSVSYTTLFSRRAMGDVLVLLFFGIVPVCTTYYVLTGGCNWYVFVASVACGFEIDSMLVINNFRDHDEDLKTGKRTLSHLLGREWMLRYYLAIGFICCGLGWFCYEQYGYNMAFNLQIIYLINHFNRYSAMRRIWEGSMLNKELAKNGQNILLYGGLIAAGVALSFM